MRSKGRMGCADGVVFYVDMDSNDYFGRGRAAMGLDLVVQATALDCGAYTQVVGLIIHYYCEA